MKVVSDDEQKKHAKITLSDDDPVVDDLNVTSIEYITDVLQRSLVKETYELYLDDWPQGSCPIEICRVPLFSVESITYIDTDGVEQTLAADQYVADKVAEPAGIYRAYEVTWPTVRAQVNSIKVTFKAGYGDAADDVPEKYKTIIKQVFTHWYHHREPMKDKNFTEIPEHLNALIAKYALKVFG